MRDGRGLTTAGLLCLLGAFVVLVAAGRTWAFVEVAAGPLVDARTDRHTGTDIVPGLSALGLLGLAGVVALAATRRTGRTLVGLLLLVLTATRGRSWPALGERSEAPARATAVAPPQEPTEPLTERSLWEAFDRGEDPTANLGTLAGAPADREADRT